MSANYTLWMLILRCRSGYQAGTTWCFLLMPRLPCSKLQALQIHRWVSRHLQTSELETLLRLTTIIAHPEKQMGSLSNTP